MKEVFKDIQDFNGYQVSSLGRIRSNKHNTPKMLKPQKFRHGYLYVNLCDKGVVSKASIHRLVAKAFIPNIFVLPQVNHKDSDKLNNNVDNLEWCTHSENMLHSFKMGTSTANKSMLGKRGVLCPNSKKVNQYTKNGEFISTYYSIVEAQEDMFGGIVFSYGTIC